MLIQTSRLKGNPYICSFDNRIYRKGERDTDLQYLCLKCFHLLIIITLYEDLEIKIR